MTTPNPEPAWQIGIERVLFASRWLVVPFYFGLLIALVMLFTVFVKGLLTYVPKMMTLELDEVILVSLALIDIALLANLVVIVVLASYEMMVSRIDTGSECPGWMGGMGFGDVKLKLFSSIVAISGIQLLKTFMGVGGPNPPHRTRSSGWSWCMRPLSSRHSCRRSPSGFRPRPRRRNSGRWGRRAQPAGRRGRISASCTMVATSLPSRSWTKPSESPRPPCAAGLTVSTNSH